MQLRGDLTKNGQLEPVYSVRGVSWWWASEGTGGRWMPGTWCHRSKRSKGGWDGSRQV